MPATFTTLQLFLNGITADLLDGVNFALVEGGYAPVMPHRNRTPLGGYMAYTDVEEQITVNVYGTDAAAMYANLERLTMMMDAASTWQDTTAPAPEAGYYLELICQPQGSTQPAALRSVIVDAQPLELPETWNDQLMVPVIENVVLHFTRRVWLKQEASVLAGAYGAQRTIQAKTFSSSLDLASPVAPFLQIGSPSAATALPNSYMLLGSGDGTQIMAFAATSISPGSGVWSSVADSAHLAPYTNVLRYTPSGTASAQTSTRALTVTSGTPNSTWPRSVVVLVTVRANSATPLFRIRAVAYDNLLRATTTTAWIDVPQVTTCQVLNLGVISASHIIRRFALEVQATVASSSLDIDTVVVMAMDNNLNTVLPIPAISSMPSGSNFGIGPGRWWVNPDALMYVYNGADNYVIRTDGRPNISMTGTYLECLWLATDSGANWQALDGSSGAATVAWSAIRRPVALLPE